MYRCADVKDKIREASFDLSKNGIFVLPPLRDDMNKLLELIHSAVIEHQINQEEDILPRMRENADELKNVGEPLFKKIEESIAARLWDSTTTEI